MLDLQAITTVGTANIYQGSYAMFFISQIISINSLSVIKTFFFEPILHMEIFNASTFPFGIFFLKHLSVEILGMINKTNPKNKFKTKRPKAM